MRDYFLALLVRLCNNDYFYSLLYMPDCWPAIISLLCSSVSFQSPLVSDILPVHPLFVAYIEFFFCTSLSLMLNSIFHFSFLVTYTTFSENRPANFSLCSIIFRHFFYLILILDCLNVLLIRHLCCIVWMQFFLFVTSDGLFECLSSIMLDCLNVVPFIHRLSWISFPHFPPMCFLYRMIALQSYPDENHSLRSVLLHVYTSMDQFWAQCFDLDNFPAYRRSH
jgi:hypothetical protein